VRFPPLFLSKALLLFIASLFFHQAFLQNCRIFARYSENLKFISRNLLGVRHQEAGERQQASDE
jgi:hypothetical protein